MKFNRAFKKVVSISAFCFIGVTHQVHADPIGAILGGLVGSQFGEGNGKIAMTVIGAVAGNLATSQYQNTQMIPTYQTAHYAPQVYNAPPLYYEPQRPNIYYSQPYAPPVYYQPAPVFRAPNYGYRGDEQRRFYGHRHSSENYREYRENRDYRGWR